MADSPIFSYKKVAPSSPDSPDHYVWVAHAKDRRCEERVKELEQENEEKQDEIDSLIQENDKLRKQISSLLRESKQKDKIIEELEMKVNVLSDNINQLKKRLDDVEYENKRLRTNNDKLLQSQNESIKKEYDARSQVKILQNKVDSQMKINQFQQEQMRNSQAQEPLHAGIRSIRERLDLLAERSRRDKIDSDNLIIQSHSSTINAIDTVSRQVDRVEAKTDYFIHGLQQIGSMIASYQSQLDSMALSFNELSIEHRHFLLHQTNLERMIDWNNEMYQRLYIQMKEYIQATMERKAIGYERLEHLVNENNAQLHHYVQNLSRWYDRVADSIENIRHNVNSLEFDQKQHMNTCIGLFNVIGQQINNLNVLEMNYKPQITHQVFQSLPEPQHRRQLYYTRN